MSNAVFPVLPGLMFDVAKAPRWSTVVHSTSSGKEQRGGFYSRPYYRWTLSFEFLRQAAAFAEYQSLVGFYNARQGQFDSFLYSDPTDNAVTTENFGTGDAAATAFQLKRAVGGASESIYNLNGAPQIYKAGVLQTVTTDYAISSTGLVTFVSAPAAAAALTWTGSFYWRVRFDTDQTEFRNFASQLWGVKSLSFVSVK